MAIVPNLFRTLPLWSPDERSSRKQEKHGETTISWEVGCPNFYEFLILCATLENPTKGEYSGKVSDILQSLGQTVCGKNRKRVEIALNKWDGLKINGKGIFSEILLAKGNVDILFSGEFLAMYAKGWKEVDVKLAYKLGGLTYRVQDFVSCTLEGYDRTKRIVFRWQTLAKKLGIKARYQRELACKIAGGCEHLAGTMGLHYAFERPGRVILYREVVLSKPSKDTVFLEDPQEFSQKELVVDLAQGATPQEIPVVVVKSQAQAFEVGDDGVIERSACRKFEETASSEFDLAYGKLSSMGLPLEYSAKRNLREYAPEVIAHAEEFVKAFRFEFVKRPSGAPALKNAIKLQDCDKAHRKITSFFQNVREIGTFDWSYFPTYYGWLKRQEKAEKTKQAVKVEIKDRVAQVATWIGGMKPMPAWKSYLVHGIEVAKSLAVGDAVMSIPSEIVPWLELSGLVQDREFTAEVAAKVPGKFWEVAFG